MPNPKPRNNIDGTVSWRVQYRVNGAVVTDTFPTFEGADDYCRLIATVGGAQARVVLDARRHSQTIPTLRAWTAEYLDAESGMLTGITDGTREGYQKDAERSFLRYLGDYPVDAIDADAVGKWVAWQEKQTVSRDKGKAEPRTISAKTMKNYHAILSTVMAAAVKRGLRPDNPARGTRLTAGMKRDAVFLSPDEFSTLLHFLPERHRRLVLFLAGTGCRWGEATAMTWGDVTLHGDTPTVRVTKAWKRSTKGSSVLNHPKTSRSRRTISLFPDLVAIMGKVGDPDALLFPNTNGHRIRYAGFREDVWVPAVRKATNKALCAAEGVHVIGRAPNIHDLRHTHASWLIARGVPLPYIQARLGHEKITTTVDTYGHLVPDAHEQMASVVAQTLAGITIERAALDA